MSHYTRSGRAADALREIRITPDFLPHTDGSCLIEAGNTKVICTASIDENVPPFLRGKGQGWVTAGIRHAARFHRLAHAPRSRRRQTKRPHAGNPAPDRPLAARSGGFGAIGRAPDFNQDCDVIQADGGTRTAAITGAFAGGAANGGKQAGGRRHVAAQPHPRSRGGRVCRRGGWRAALGFGLSRRFGLRQRCANMVLTASGNIIEIRGHRRGRALQPARIECLDAAWVKRRVAKNWCNTSSRLCSKCSHKTADCAGNWRESACQCEAV